MFTDAGISCTVRPSRLALAAIRLPLSGVGTTVVALPGGVDTASGPKAGCVVGARFGAVCVAVRLARFEGPCDPLPLWFGVSRGVGGATVTGLSCCWLCANTGCDALATAKRIPTGSAEPDSQHRLDEIGLKADARQCVRSLVAEVWEIGTVITNGEQ
jgi:hypothetical protein